MEGDTEHVRVLIAEDEARLAGILREVIEEAGSTADIATTGGEALRAARQVDYDVLLLDWMLPVLDGPGVIAALRRDGHRIPILLLTARGELADRVHGLDVVLGAMLARMVLRRWTRRMDVDTAGLEHKFDAVGYGLFIPIFFIYSGMSFDLKSIIEDPLRLLVDLPCGAEHAACGACARPRRDFDDPALDV